MSIEILLSLSCAISASVAGVAWLRNSKLKEELAKLQNYQGASSTEKVFLDKEVGQWKASASQIKGDYDRLADEAKILRLANAEIPFLRSKEEESERERAEVCTRLTTKEREYSDLQSRYSASVAELSKSQEYAKGLMAQIEELRKRANELNQAIDRARSEGIREGQLVTLTGLRLKLGDQEYTAEVMGLKVKRHRKQVELYAFERAILTFGLDQVSVSMNPGAALAALPHPH